VSVIILKGFPLIKKIVKNVKTLLMGIVVKIEGQENVNVPKSCILFQKVFMLIIYLVIHKGNVRFQIKMSVFYHHFSLRIKRKVKEIVKQVQSNLSTCVFGQTEKRIKEKLI
jgi:hypothetical protein